MPRTFVCEHCQKEFVDLYWAKTRRFCSRECERSWRKAQMRTIPCEQCGKLFYVHPGDQRRFCSKPCQALGTRKPGANNKQFVCETCGKTFTDTGWAKQRKYCSLTCSNAPRQVRVEVTCLNCGKTSLRKKGWAENSSVHFCNRECRNAYQSGKGHPKWRGGAAQWYGSNWLRQAAAARKRDGYCCRCCGVSQSKLGVTLDVHHVVPFRAFGVSRCEEANDLGNLITLCRHCHAQVEWHNAPLQLPLTFAST